MVTYDCDTCEDTGLIPWMVEMDPHHYMEPDSDGMIPCPDCQHDPATCPDGHEERWPSPVARLRRAARERYGYARSLWRERDCRAIAAVTHAHREVLHDEPRLRSTIESDLRDRLAQTPTPLGWRRTDLLWSLRNAWGAVRGRQPEPTPYEVSVTVEVLTRDPGAFERGFIALRAECQRVRRRS